MNATAEQPEPASIFPLSPCWEEEKAPLPPPTTRLMLNLRLKALRERLGLLERQHAENVATLDQRDADVEAYCDELEASRRGRPRLVKAATPKAHRRPGPYFEGAGGWTAEHGIDWLAEGKAARAAMYPDVDEEAWVSIEAARELGPDVVASIDPTPGARRRRKPEEPQVVAPEVAPAVELVEEPAPAAVSPVGQLLLFPAASPAATVAEKRKRRRPDTARPKQARCRVPPCQLALLEAPTGPPRHLRVNLLRAA